MIMNDELLKMLPMSEIDADIHSSVPGYWQQTKRPSIWSAWKQGAQWERNRAKKEGGWISVKESLPTTDGLYFTKGGLRKYNIMYFRDGKFFTHRHSDTYDSGIEFYKPVEN